MASLTIGGVCGQTLAEAVTGEEVAFFVAGVLLGMPGKSVEQVEFVVSGA